MPFREKPFCFVESNDIRVADIVGVFVILPVLNPAAVFAKAVAVRVDKNAFTANLAGCLNFGIPVSHFFQRRGHSRLLLIVYGALIFT